MAGAPDATTAAEVPVRARLVVRISPADVGRRVSVRSRLHGEAQAATDALGVLRSWTDGVLVVERRDGTRAVIAEADLLAGRPVPPAPVRPPPVDGR